jgi:hypothetical protein
VAHPGQQTIGGRDERGRRCVRRDGPGQSSPRR